MKILQPVLFLLASLLFGLSAHARPVDAGHAVAEIISERAETVPGDQFKAALSLQLDEGWHVYWRNAGDSGLPPMITWNETSGATIGEFSWPAPNEQPLEGLMNYGYEDHLVLPFDVTVPADFDGRELVLRGYAEWLICLDICIPESADLIAFISVGDGPEVNQLPSELIAQSLSEVPVEFSGQASLAMNDGSWTLSVQSEDIAKAAAAPDARTRFFPFDHQIEHPAEQSISVGENGISVSLTPHSSLAKDTGISGVIVVRTSEGEPASWTVNASPGETLDGTTGTSLSAAGNVAVAGQSGGLIVWLGAALIGGLILNLMPCVLPVLTIKAMGLVQTAANGNAAELRRHGVAYLAGVLICFAAIGAVLAGLIAAGEQTGLGFQLQYPPVVVALALLMFLIGLNMLGFFEIGGSVIGAGGGLTEKPGSTGAFFTGVLAAVVGAPCVGPFLGAALGAVVSQPAWVMIAVFLTMGFGMALPFVIFSFVPASTRLLPKPGPWMVRLRQFFSFPLFLTAIWLLWVLAGLAGESVVLLTLLGATAIGFAIWLFQSAADNGAGRVIAIGTGVAALLFGVIAPVAASGVGNRSTAEIAASASQSYGAEWSRDRVAELTAEGRGIFVDFTARWCVTCQVNKQTTLTTASVRNAFERNDIEFLVADWTNRDDVIAAELQRHGRAGVPLYLFYAPGETTPQILPQILRPDMVIDMVEPG